MFGMAFITTRIVIGQIAITVIVVVVFEKAKIIHIHMSGRPDFVTFKAVQS